LIAFTLTGCISKSVYLQHPVTGQVVKCDSIGGIPPFWKMFRESREECQVRWQHQGYQEVEPSEKVLAAPRADK
jgi:hypothetical protein